MWIASAVFIALAAHFGLTLWRNAAATADGHDRPLGIPIALCCLFTALSLVAAGAALA